MSLSAYLKQAREATGITQGELSKKTKIPADQISAFERAKAVPTDNQIKLIAKALNVSAAQLLRAKKPATKSSATKLVVKPTLKASAVKASSTKVSTTSTALTPNEKQLISLYRKADTNTKNAVIDFLSKSEQTNTPKQTSKTKEPDLFGDILQGGIGDVVSDVIGNVLGGILKK